MEAPAVTRRHSPFFAPIWLILLGAIALGLIAWSSYRAAGTTLVVLVRSPDKEPGTIADPPISADGEARAQRLARMFGDTTGAGRWDAVYVSDDRRAQQTAALLADRLGRAPVLFNVADAAATGARLAREHAGGTVLVIGGGASVARMLTALAGPQAGGAMAADPDCLYIVSVPSFGRAQVLRIRF